MVFNIADYTESLDRREAETLLAEARTIDKA